MLMNKTFEETVTPKLDMMYRGALFLAAGRAHDAERLLLEAVRTAFRRHGESLPESEADHWLEAQLAHSFLDSESLADVRSERSPGEVHGVDPVYPAASVLPPKARVAIWLVVVRRWKYEAAAETLQLPMEEFSGLLTHRKSFLAALRAESSPATDERNASAGE